MNLQEFTTSLADVEGKEALEKYVKDFWMQASDEDRAVVIQGIECLSGHIRKVVKSFWELCGIAYSNGWITVDGKSYAITPEIKPDNARDSALYLQAYSEKGKQPDQVAAAEEYYTARQPTLKPIRVLEGGVREVLDGDHMVIKNDMTYKVRGE